MYIWVSLGHSLGKAQSNEEEEEEEGGGGGGEQE
jgi:hypothetical protein